MGAIQGQLETLNRYPDPDKSVLRRRIAERTGLSSERVAVGNGSCEILLAAGDALLEPGAEVVYAWPSFSIYPNLAAQTGAPRGDRAAGLRRAVTISRRWPAR